MTVNTYYESRLVDRYTYMYLIGPNIFLQAK